MKGAVEQGRGGAVLRCQKTIARAHGEPVRVANDGAEDQPHIEIEIFNKTPDDHRLLEILLTEVGDGGLDEVQELENHRGDAAKMPGTQRSFERPGDGAWIDESVEAGGIHVAGLGSEHCTDVERSE